MFFKSLDNFVKILIWKTDPYLGKVMFYHTAITSQLGL